MGDSSPSYIPTTWLEGHERFIERYLQQAKVVFYKPQEIICRQDEPIDQLFLILRGVIEVSYTHSDGQVKIAALNDRGTLAGVAGLDESWGHHTLTCRTPAVVAVVPKESIYRWDSEMLLDLLRMQTRKLELAFQQLKENSTASVRSRLVRLLLERGRMERLAIATELPVRFPLSKLELANLIGSTRERVSQVLRELHGEGLVEMAGKEIGFYLSALARELGERN